MVAFWQSKQSVILVVIEKHFLLPEVVSEHFPVEPFIIINKNNKITKKIFIFSSHNVKIKRKILNQKIL